MGELQALSSHAAFRGPDLSLSYLPEFVVKMQLERNPLPCSFLVKLLLEFVGDLPEERSLCPVHAVRIYLDLTLALSLRPRSLFVLPYVPRVLFLRTPCFIFVWLLNDLTGPSAGPLARIPYFNKHSLNDLYIAQIPHA